MIRVALCGHIASQADIAQVLTRCAHEQGVGVLTLDYYDNPTDLVVACTDADDEEHLYDLVISALTLPGVSGMQLATELSRTASAGQNARCILCAPDESRAREASAQGVRGYLIEPVDEEDLVRVASRLLSEIAREHKTSVVVRCRDGMRRISFSHLAYVETSGRDQLLYTSTMDTAASMRCSSRAMFALLEHDSRFYKLGSSYIVNLDYVISLSLRSGMVELFDGTQIPAPVRLRKLLSEALCNHALAAV